MNTIRSIQRWLVVCLLSLLAPAQTMAQPLGSAADIRVGAFVYDVSIGPCGFLGTVALGFDSEHGDSSDSVYDDVEDIVVEVAEICSEQGCWSAARGGGTEIVERAMSRAELDATRATGLVRGGRDGTHFVSDAVNNNANRARQRLALPQTPEVKVQLEVPRGSFGPPSRVGPANGMLGGGMERTGTGQIPATVRGVRDL